MKGLMNLYCEVFGTRSYGGDALASSCVLRHMNSSQIFHNINSITYKYLLTFRTYHISLQSILTHIQSSQVVHRIPEIMMLKYKK